MRIRQRKTCKRVAAICWEVWKRRNHFVWNNKRTEASQLVSSARQCVAWFKVAVSVTDSDSPETYRSRCINRVSADTQNKMIKIPKYY